MKTPSLDRAMFGATAACVVVTAVEMLWPHPLHVPSIAAPVAASPETPQIPALELARDYMLTIDRPLFTVDRRPYEVPPNAEAAKLAAAPTPELNAQLIAVVRVGDEQMILLRLAQAVRKLRSGETVDGWTVKRIDGVSAVVSNGSFERTLELDPVAVARR